MSDPFDLEQFQSLPRLSGLRLSPDGRRLTVAVARRSADRKEQKTAIWAVDPTGATAPRRLTRSAAGESGAEHLPDGSLLFVSARPDPEAAKDAKPVGALWHLPADGGEARLLLAPPAGIDGFAAARDAGTVVLLAGLHPDAADFDADRAREQEREDAGVQARLYESYPIRYWDHYHGPRQARWFVADPPAPGDPDATLGSPEDLTGASGTALPEPDVAISPDGRTVATTWRRSKAGDSGDDIVLIDRATRERHVLTGGTGWSGTPAFSPDGRWLVFVQGSTASPDRPIRQQLTLVELATGNQRTLARDLDRWPIEPRFTPDSGAVVFTADDEGGCSIYRVELDGDRVTRLASGAAFNDPCVSPDGATLYALRSHPDRPPHIVRLAATGPADQTPTELPFPGLGEDELPPRGRIERLRAIADDGVAIGSWLLLPPDASPDRPAPLVVFVHGGPLGTWAGWSWRWNANLLTARGYAVLMPDPAISLGYGQAFVDRGWGRWGDRPYTDVMTAVDGALMRPDIDAERTALMGGSFGGYMANWVAGHTDRFRAIVTHASLWELRGFHGTTDDGVEWEQEFGDPYADPSRYLEHSPAAHVGAIRTPMLVIHGELDARVPVSEALRLWTDLYRHGVDAKFLYFPDEHHWVLKPQNARIWYETVFAFLDHHVLGAPWVRPALL